ncbi:hypothetical protein BGP75_21400 [Motiliproteus sp. MSK22-1]|nr:hypothetical protein BGP75_21400 [Motiliproteus sp. MSK22-1]
MRRRIVSKKLDLLFSFLLGSSIAGFALVMIWLMLICRVMVSELRMVRIGSVVRARTAAHILGLSEYRFSTLKQTIIK